jgi:hypothetical protein
MKSLRTPIADISFDENDNILHIKVREGAEMTLENATTHYRNISDLIGNKKYLALVDAKEPFTINQDAWQFASHKEVATNRVAVAHYNSCPSNKLTMNFFKSVYDTSMPIKIFNSESEARQWLFSFKSRIE